MRSRDWRGLEMPDSDHWRAALWASQARCGVSARARSARPTEALAAPARTAIAWFLYDADRDGATSAEPVALFSSFPFLNGVDAWFEPGGAPLKITFNGRSLTVPASPAGVAGPVVATFD